MASILTYVLGCVWYLICLDVFYNRFKMGYPEEDTFFTTYSIYKKEPLKRLALSCYYVLTGLTTVGYGDFNAQNTNEKIFGITVMFMGVTIFSYVMSEFSDQINLYNKTFGDRDQDSALTYYINLLGKFSPNKPLDKNLISKIKKHFIFFWKNNRMHSIDKQDKYLYNLPKDLKISLVEYFWYDIFAKFNDFLLYRRYKNIYYKFYYELSFLLLPRLFSKDEIVYEGGEEVEEMYLIQAEATAYSDAATARELLTDFMRTYRYNTYNCRATDLNGILQEIILQKRIELWGEGQTFFDVKRLNLSVTRNYEGTNFYAKSAYNTTGRPWWMNITIPDGASTSNLALYGYGNPQNNEEELRIWETLRFFE